MASAQTASMTTWLLRLVRYPKLVPVQLGRHYAAVHGTDTRGSDLSTTRSDDPHGSRLAWLPSSRPGLPTFHLLVVMPTCKCVNRATGGTGSHGSRGACCSSYCQVPLDSRLCPCPLSFSWQRMLATRDPLSATAVRMIVLPTPVSRSRRQATSYDAALPKR